VTYVLLNTARNAGSPGTPEKSVKQKLIGTWLDRLKARQTGALNAGLYSKKKVDALIWHALFVTMSGAGSAAGISIRLFITHSLEESFANLLVK